VFHGIYNARQAGLSAFELVMIVIAVGLVIDWLFTRRQ